MMPLGNNSPRQQERDLRRIKLAVIDLAILRLRLDSNEPISDILLDEGLR